MAVKLPITLTKEQQAQTLANYLPGGRVFAAKNLSGSNLRKLLRGLAEELLRVDSIVRLFRKDTVPDETRHFIDEWESAVGIPDSCFKGTGTDEKRRLAITAKLAALGVQIDSDFVDLAAKFGVSITVESGSVHGCFPFVFPIKFYPSARDARFTLVVRPTETIGDTFTYTFPIAFGTEELGIIQCLFRKVKPANVNVVFEDIV